MTTTTQRSPRDGFLDALRAIATIRVVVWHAFGAAIISWFIAAIPSMFVVFGSLLDASVERRSYVRVIIDRARRVLLPLWLFVVVTWLAIAASGVSMQFRFTEFLLWMFPIADPRAMSWESGWLSSPLWFIRMVLWLLVLAPALLPLARKYWRATLLVLALGTFVAEFAGRYQALIFDGAPRLWWHVGDVALYGFFMVLGVGHHRGQIVRLSRRQWILLAVLSGVGAIAWRMTQPVPDGVVNNSHPLHLLVGLGWLALAFAFQRTIVSFASRPGVSAVVRLVTRRSMTIYLWHTTAISAALWLLARFVDVGFARPLLYVVLISAGTYLATLLFGWVEDIAASRPASVHRVGIPVRERRSSVIVAAAIGTSIVLSGAIVSVNTSMNAAPAPPPIPSQQPPAPKFTRSMRVSDVPRTVPKSQLSAELRREIRTWRAQQSASGVAMMVLDEHGNRWSASEGKHADGKSDVRVQDTFDIGSITKLMTATLIYRLSDEGKLDLDAPLPRFIAVPEFPYSDELSARLLLSHQSGLVNYRDTSRYLHDQSSVASPYDAVVASIGEPLGFQPGTTRNYSSVNYLLLGFLIEHVTGRHYDDVLRDDLLAPLHLEHTSSLPSSPGEPSYSTAGTLTNLDDLVVMTQHLLGKHELISEASYAAMTLVDTETALGAGVIGFCPCTVDEAGQKSFYSIGHYGADTVVAYVPSSRLVVGIRVTDGVHAEGRLEATTALMARAAQLVGQATEG